MKLRKTDIKLYRLTPKDNDGIYGRLHVPEERLDCQRIVHKIDTLERPYKGNERFVSSIPIGLYRLRRQKWGRYFDAYKKRWGHEYVVEIAGVPGRDGILIHTGNFIKHSKGCILVGQRVRRQGEKMLENSRNRYEIFYNLIDKLFREVETKYDKENQNIMIEVCEGKDEG